MERDIKIDDWKVPFSIKQISTENEMSTNNSTLLYVKNEPIQETIIVKTEAHSRRRKSIQV